MSQIDFNPAVYQLMIENFGKTLVHTPVTTTTSNLDGREILVDGTPANITGTFYKKEDVYMQEKQSLMKNADAIIMVLPAVSIKRNDKISYNSDTFRVDEVEQRFLGTTEYYKMVRCFLI